MNASCLFEGAQLPTSLANSFATEERIRKAVLPRFPVPPDATIAPLGQGLINETFLIQGADARWVLQRINPLFPATIHENIQAVTDALTRAGLVTQVLVPTIDGTRWLEVPTPEKRPPIVWRLMTYVDGVSFDVVQGPAQSRAAGAMVARFHAALDDVSHTFVGLRTGVHDTARHLRNLRHGVAAHPNHRLFRWVSALADGILAGADELPSLPAVAARVCHGDLKFNNLLFAGPDMPLQEKAVCLIDLDTVGPMSLAFEMGDAWRSWCNRNGENNERADLDLDLFAASLEGYREGLGRSLSADERAALLLGPEWISLELSARFAADALTESYFGWDRERFAGRGEHNLVRARGQFSMYQALVGSRPRRARLLGS